MQKFHLDPEKYHCKHSDKSLSGLPPTSYGPLYIRLPVRLFHANCSEVKGILWILRYFSREVASDFLFLCRHLLEFQNEAWSSLNQLNGKCDAPPTFPLAPLDFEYLVLPQVYTFFWWRLYFY